MIVKSTIIILIAFIFGWVSTHAQPVSEKEAAYLAVNFLSDRSEGRENLAMEEIFLHRSGAVSLYYIINFSERGFIVVSADKRFYPVLAYSFEGRFDKANMPGSCWSWFEWYEAQMLQAFDQEGPFMEEMPGIWDKIGQWHDDPEEMRDMQPLTTSSWSQFGNYNQMCPSDPEAYNGHVPVGCVALAMAQLLYYYRFPASGNGSELYTPGYMGGIYGPQFVDFSAASYHWSSMPDICHDPSEETAELCYHTGVSLRTSYKPESSGADIYDVPAELREHFFYLADDYLPRNDVPVTAEWVGMLMDNLDRHQPVIYRSTNGWSGHVYLCDGYQDSTHFHFNWGWGGAFNGYYYIDALTPAGLNLNFAQGAVMNIFPDTTLFSYPSPLPDTMILTDPSGSIDDGSGPGDYPDDISRSWLIQLHESHASNIFLEFSMFSTEPGADWVRIYDGNSSEAPLLATLSGKELPVALESSGAELFLTFESDAQYRGQGFHASYYGFQLPFCSGEPWLTAANGELEDGSRYLDYRNGTDCDWVIAPHISPQDSIAAIRLSFNRFDLAEGDTIYFFDAMEGTGLPFGRFAAGDSPGSIVSPGNKVLVRFRTDESFTAGGWELSWDPILPVYCQDTSLFFEPADTIEDGSSFKNYVENSDCYYLIDLSGNPFVTIRFLEFDLELNYDFLKFYDADHPQTHLYKFSGSSVPQDVSLTVERLLIYFHSDDLFNHSGWRLSYTASGTGLPEEQGSFSIYPNPARDEIFIHRDIGLQDRWEYKILRPDGMLMLTGELYSSDGHISLDRLSPGLFILTLEMDGLAYHHKFIKYR